MARLDRLGPAKQVAQVGAVIGREFSPALLEAVMPHEGGTLQRLVDQLESLRKEASNKSNG
jgi:predicted ATPase